MGEVFSSFAVMLESISVEKHDFLPKQEDVTSGCSCPLKQRLVAVEGVDRCSLSSSIR